MKYLKLLWTFIKDNHQRFLWEVLAVLFSSLIGYGASFLTTKNDLKACQDERNALLKENASHQALADSIRWSGRMAEKQLLINSLVHANLQLREKMAVDSARQLSKLEAMRAVNARYRRH